MRAPDHDIRTLRDRDAIREHESRRARGDRRLLWRSVDGELRLYRRSELGFDKRCTRQVIGFRGLLALQALMTTVFVVATAAVVVIVGTEKNVGAFALLTLLSVGVVWNGVYVAQEVVARYQRRRRGIPEPTKDGR